MKPFERGETVIERFADFVLKLWKFSQGEGDTPYSEKYESIVSLRPADSALRRIRAPDEVMKPFNAASGSLARRSTASGGKGAVTSGCSASSSGVSSTSTRAKALARV